MPKKLLIVEDEAPLLETISKILSQNYQVIQASDGSQGFNKALVEKPDLILLDVILPIMDGVEVLAKLRADPWGKNVPIIILTNLMDMNIELKSKELGVSGYYIKANLSIKNLSNEIKNILK